MRKLYATFVLLFFVAFYSNAQSTLGTAALVAPNEYRLTAETPIIPPGAPGPGQAGAVWKNTPVNLNTAFTVDVYMNWGRFGEGTPDPNNPYSALTDPNVHFNTGADGMAFVLAPAAYVGVSGEGMGYKVYGGNSSFAAEFDTWQNNSDPQGGLNNDIVNDHMAFMRNGNNVHGGVNSTPVQDLGNIETNTWYHVVFTWTPGVGLSVNFNNGAATLNTTAADVLASFGGNANALVQWGFTGGTYSGTNDQRVRVNFNPPVPCTPARTQTMGAWGQKAAGNNPGSYRNSHFGSAFPAGVMIGLPGHSAKWTTAAAVQNFLPAGGPSVKLPAGDFVNPTSQVGGNAVGQVLTLSLSVGFDAADANFSPSPTPLSAYVINAGPFAGWTVGAFLAEANNVLGGAASAFSVSDVQTTAGAINENYDNGTTNNGYLSCPNQVVSRAAVNTAETVANTLSAFPNPSRGLVKLNLGNNNATSDVVVVNSNGMIVERRANVSAQNLSMDLSKYGAGYYLVKVVSGSSVKTTKVVVQ